MEIYWRPLTIADFPIGERVACFFYANDDSLHTGYVERISEEAMLMPGNNGGLITHYCRVNKPERS